MREFSMATVITLFILLVSTAYAQTGTIAVKVAQIVVQEGGKVKIGIYGPKGFPVVGKEIHGINLEVKGTSAEYVFKNIPVGNYAIAVFQDVNNDGKLNKNLFGAPSEPYGFSENQYGIFGPPDFEDVSFHIKENKSISFTINLE